MKESVLYVHGKCGSAAESERYRPLFPGCEVFGLDYQTSTPWEAGAEICAAAEKLKAEYESIILIANSIGAFFSMNAGIDSMIRKAYFISPIVAMEKLIGDMMQWANVTEAELKSKVVIHTSFGEDLSWEYLRYVREHPIRWSVPTNILYGSKNRVSCLHARPTGFCQWAFCVNAPGQGDPSHSRCRSARTMIVSVRHEKIFRVVNRRIILYDIDSV